ncbi:N-methyl-L-tryptophan oxidase [Nannocystis radixulma]|uniref:N-methyl-L-tryptophan oxidase n=1 Tax=Nannocystis radixulma TaxID=2995305 RepID=A0ABT5BS87_9BACT|nr:N-methyl-L-tryptophan oxidase [Nannocystis radixulma]MDC0675847.1 N-methyl-L-tryptophan oxidase [Nannocystis radixulma]
MARGPKVIVIGGGTMGSATAWALAARGAEVTVLERFSHVHEYGSHSGFTRIIRESYHEGAGYVPLVRRADALWQAVGERVGERLLVRTGMVEFGPESDPEYQGAIAACRAAEVAHELMDAAEARRRFPIAVPDGWTACFTPSGGYLRVGPCLEALKREAMSLGSDWRTGVRVREVALGERPRVLLEEGTLLPADQVVVTAGAYLPELLPGFLPGKLKVLRRVLAWTRPDPREVPRLAAMPVWAGFTPQGFMYGFPHGDEGVTGFKLACHVPTADPEEAAVDPERVDRSIHPADLAPLAGFLDAYLPAGRGEFVHATVCLYTCTPSTDFVIDHVPGDRRVWVAGGFSGHGFKFAPAIGELVAEAVVTGEAPEALRAFARARHGG